jgi:hypothetical protein
MVKSQSLPARNRLGSRARPDSFFVQSRAIAGPVNLTRTNLCERPLCPADQGCPRSYTARADHPVLHLPLSIPDDHPPWTSLHLTHHFLPPQQALLQVPQRSGKVDHLLDNDQLSVELVRGLVRVKRGVKVGDGQLVGQVFEAEDPLIRTRSRRGASRAATREA